MGFLIIMIFGTLLIASAAVFFSVLGLVQTFSETAIYWGTSIEIAKLILASFLYRYWNKINIIAKFISMAFIGLLMSITSLGIYGHIITSYQEGTLQVDNQKIRLETEQKSIERIEQRIQNVNRQIETKKQRIAAIEEDIARVPDNYVTVRRELIQERKPEMDRLENEIDKLFEDREILYDELSKQEEKIANMRIETGEIENKVGPIMFVIEQLGGVGERAVFWFVLIIVLSFDPTAVSLTVYSNKVAVDLQSKNKEKNKKDNESTEIEENTTIENNKQDSSSEDNEQQLTNFIEKITEKLDSQSNQLEELNKFNKKEKEKDSLIKSAIR